MLRGAHRANRIADFIDQQLYLRVKVLGFTGDYGAYYSVYSLGVSGVEYNIGHLG